MTTDPSRGQAIGSLPMSAMIASSSVIPRNFEI
jgi:hypothetical protein